LAPQHKTEVSEHTGNDGLLTLRGTAYLLHRIGFSVQVPQHRAVERDEAAVTTWRREAWPAGKR
jgi:hypothetical protein